MSAEIEVSNSDPSKAFFVNDALAKWQSVAVRDGSLPQEGYEINTAPAKDEMFDNQIIEICDSLASAKAFVNRKCGLHVHIDARDMNYYDLRKILQVYWAVEDDMFNMLAHHRRENNRFCLRVKRGQGWSDILNRKLSNDEWRAAVMHKMYSFKHNEMDKRAQNGFRTHKYDNARYYALNLHSWFFRKTVEFRHHHGTIDKTKILNWAHICEKVIDFAMRSSERDIKSQFLNNPEPLASILPPSLKSYYLERKTFFKTNALDPEQEQGMNGD